jgi:hypothetical protein
MITTCYFRRLTKKGNDTSAWSTVQYNAQFYFYCPEEGMGRVYRTFFTTCVALCGYGATEIIHVSNMENLSSPYLHALIPIAGCIQDHILLGYNKLDRS